MAFGIPRTQAPRGSDVGDFVLTEAEDEVAAAMAQDAAAHDFETATYLISSTYTGVLPSEYRARFGIFFTPPALVNRLLDLVEGTGIEWSKARVLDPACGGGAFLAPVAERIIRSSKAEHLEAISDRVAKQLRGYEIDSYLGWLSTQFLRFQLVRYGLPRKFSSSVCSGDALDHTNEANTYDLVIGNPPYGRTTLSPVHREVFARSLYGHANLYGVFTDLAVRLTRSNGVIAFVTPASFLSGEYFKNLRYLLAAQAPPIAIDFVSDRSGVFAGVLQETVMIVLKKQPRQKASVVVSHATPSGLESPLEIRGAGPHRIPDGPGPWILPRAPKLRQVAERAAECQFTLKDLGVSVSTGPLVWNRHKDQLKSDAHPGTLPLIWSECVLPGRFVFRALKKNHAPFFELRPRQSHLVTRESCVLVQRTTATEQRRRLIAAVLPGTFVADHGGVVVENHPNIVRGGSPLFPLDLEAVAVFLNSNVADALLRCISGSVAISAFEIEQMPIPTRGILTDISDAIRAGRSRDDFDALIAETYGVEFQVDDLRDVIRGSH
ncbi:MAG: HsdM family class I SAM-dependent methyltransferase [Gemmatimonadota bacterium]